MNGYNRNLALLGELNTPIIATSQEENDRMYAMVMQKAGLSQPPAAAIEFPGKKVPGRPNRKRFFTLLMAAVLAAALLAAAGYLSASDVFRNIFKEQGSDGEPSNLSSQSPVVDRAGVVVDETRRTGEIEVTLKAVAGDENNMSALFEIVDKSGGNLGLVQDDGHIASGNISFGSTEVSGDWTSQGPMPLKTDGNRALVLVDAAFSESIRGDTISLSLQDIVQRAYLPGSKKPLRGNALYEAASQFDTARTQDLTLVHTNMSGDEEYALMKDGGKTVQLPDAYSGYSITNAVYDPKEQKLYLRGHAPQGATRRDIVGLLTSRFEFRGTVHANNELAGDEQMHGFPDPEQTDCGSASLVLRDTNTGVTDSSYAMYWFDDSGPNLAFSLTMNRVESLEFLKDKEVLADYLGSSRHLMHEGTWDFEFKVDYSNTTIRYDLDQKMPVSGDMLTLETITISPFRVKIMAMRKKLTLSEEVEQALTDLPLVLTMKDGSAVTIPQESVTLLMGLDLDMPIFDAVYFSEVIINPSEVVGASLGGQRVDLPDNGS